MCRTTGVSRVRSTRKIRRAARGRSCVAHSRVRHICQSTYMTHIIGSIHLNEESIRIPKLERFLRPAGLNLQVALLQLSGYIVGVETGNAEIVVIECRGVAFLLD